MITQHQAVGDWAAEKSPITPTCLFFFLYISSRPSGRVRAEAEVLHVLPLNVGAAMRRTARSGVESK